MYASIFNSPHTIPQDQRRLNQLKKDYEKLHKTVNQRRHTFALKDNAPAVRPRNNANRVAPMGQGMVWYDIVIHNTHTY